MIQNRVLLPVLLTLLSLLAACGSSQQSLIDSSKAVCPEGKTWDGAQCIDAPGGSEKPETDAPASK